MADDEPIKRKQCESTLLFALMDEVASTIEILLEQGIFPQREGSSETAVENALNLARVSGDRNVISLLESHIEHLDERGTKHLMDKGRQLLGKAVSDRKQSA